MAEVKVLVEGVMRFDENMVATIGCTSTLIKSDKNIIVDPGSFVNKDKLIEALSKEGLKPEDINYVILTHTHIDHTANMILFNKSPIVLRFIGESDYPGQFQTIDQGKLRRFDLIKEEIAKDVKIIETPGHAMDCVSVLVKTNDGNIVIAGDCIPIEKFMDLKNEPDPRAVQNVSKFNESRKKILEIADYVILGHGGMVKVKK
ncbi:MAG: MBL fold metallo-hydrolase [archaeon]|nr:MAG: MBL fold metallo-hydrolase [archaeon]